MQENEAIPPEREPVETPAPDLQPLEARAGETSLLQPDAADQLKEDAPMLDVHPPHEPIHTWKEYLLHMSTIVLGLLIAIGLEQSVEAVHRNRERSELRESLRRESEQALKNAEQTEQVETAPLLWLNARLELIETAVDERQPLPSPLPRKPHVVSSQFPVDPAWNAAKSSGLLALLTQQEVGTYSEADYLFARLKQLEDLGHAASYRRAEFEVRHARVSQHSAMLDLSHASPDELEKYIQLLLEEYGAWDEVRVGCQMLRGIETAILSGERDLGRIQKSSQQFYSPEPRVLDPKAIQ